MNQSILQQRYQVLLLSETGKISQKKASQILKLSERQIRRSLRKLKRNGFKIDCLQFQSHPAWNRTDKEVEDRVLKLQEKWTDPKGLDKGEQNMRLSDEGQKERTSS